jgi:hypothetical protein
LMPHYFQPTPFDSDFEAKVDFLCRMHNLTRGDAERVAILGDELRHQQLRAARVGAGSGAGASQSNSSASINSTSVVTDYAYGSSAMAPADSTLLQAVERLCDKLRMLRPSSMGTGTGSGVGSPAPSLDGASVARGRGSGSARMGMGGRRGGGGSVPARSAAHRSAASSLGSFDESGLDAGSDRGNLNSSRRGDHYTYTSTSDLLSTPSSVGFGATGSSAVEADPLQLGAAASAAFWPPVKRARMELDATAQPQSQFQPQPQLASPHQTALPPAQPPLQPVPPHPNSSDAEAVVEAHAGIRRTRSDDEAAPEDLADDSAVKRTRFVHEPGLQ